MKKKITKYILIIFGTLVSIIIYLTVIGVETDRFNKKIISKISQTNNQLELKLNKIRLTLDPLNLKINIKTIGTKIVHKKKIIELEYIKSKISIYSLFKNKIISSNVKLSTKSILLKDLVGFAKKINNQPELFLLENLIKSGYVIADIEINFDENGEIKKDYKINGLLRDGDINIIQKYKFKKINLSFKVEKNNFNFQDINFKTDDLNFSSKYLKVIKNKKDYFFEGTIENEDSNLNAELFQLLNLDLENLNFKNTNFDSKNNFSFKINNKFNLKDFNLVSEIRINNSEYKRPNIVNNNFMKMNDLIYLKDHQINVIYKDKNLSIKGLGKIKLEKEFDEIDYVIIKEGKNLDFTSNIKLSELILKNQNFTKKIFPAINDQINLKDHQINVIYKDKNLSIKGLGKIKLEKEFDEIDYNILKNKNKFEFKTNLNLYKTLFKIDQLNYKKNKKTNTELNIVGDYEKNKGLNLYELSIVEKNSHIIIKNFILNKENKILKVDEVDLDYLDIENKKNKVLLLRSKKNNYEIKGSVFNGNTLISDLLKGNEKKHSRIFKNNINLTLNLSEVYIDEKNVIKDLKGKIFIKDNKLTQANIKGFFDDNENLTFTVSTNNDEKVTTLFSSRAKPLVKRYKFIKGYEEGYLDFYSSKKNNISNSKLKLYNFKLQELPALTKILTLASLQGIADLLSGEGIRFNEFEMNFKNKKDLMKIDEIYAIGPAISILMEGYIEKDKLISLRGTLVPATTLNKVIGSIPFLGKILVGSKTGEGVFGVSFKIKGPPKDLETTVNPIKTLTPRFITRTLEKIKKN